MPSELDKTKIRIVDLDPSLATSYAKGGRTRTTAGIPIPWPQVIPVGKSKSSTWRATKATAAALLEADVDAQVLASGRPKFRLTEVLRPHKAVELARQKYDRWIEEGEPDPDIPGSGFNSRRHKAAYVARPNLTNHQWGGAVDFDIPAWALECGHKLGIADRNAALSQLWDVLLSHGFTPVIAEPNAGQSECWHFDHFGSLRHIREFFYEHRDEGWRYRPAYSNTAMACNVLAGTFVGKRQMERLVQARLLAGGYWCGLVDGYIGKMTLTALLTVHAEAEKPAPRWNKHTPAAEILTVLNELEVGSAAIMEA